MRFSNILDDYKQLSCLFKCWGDNASYWTRSPNVSYSSYSFMVDENGSLYGYFYPYNEVVFV